MRLRFIAASVISAVLAVVALFLLTDHPSVRARSTGQNFQCLATYDIVLNNAYNDPDGFPPLPREHLGARCVDQAHQRFRASIVLGSVAAVIPLAGFAIAIRRRNREG